MPIPTVFMSVFRGLHTATVGRKIAWRTGTAPDQRVGRRTVGAAMRREPRTVRE